MIILKIVLIGDGNVGKTSLRHRFTNDEFQSTYKMTIGAEFSSYQIKVGDRDVKFQIWDLAGQPFFYQVRSSYYSGAAGCVLVYDVTKKDSFENIPLWIKEALDHSGVDSPALVLLGNKIDMRSTLPSSLTPKHGQALAREINRIPRKKHLRCKYFETSAKTGENVEIAFKELTKLILAGEDESERLQGTQDTKSMQTSG